VLPALNLTEKPAFEARDPFWFPAFNGDWAARNFSNSQNAHLQEKHGGKVVYKGFVHTFYPLVPPEKHFKDHPEWYSLLNGTRTTEGAQLCTTNPELRAFLVERVKEWLRESPETNILSVSQNDWYGACQCDRCKEIDEREGSHAGTLLALVNYIAERIQPEFPQVAIDTLAYQYTRKAPKTLKPLPNVIVRLCSIECDFRQPLEAKSNAAFADDIRQWSQKSDRLYIWDYTTNFAHYVQPHPNWFTLGENVRFFHKNGVRGLFEQGAYQSHGSEMSEMRGWVLAQLLWNPAQDERKLIREFLNGYYGDAAPFIWEYLNLLTEASKGFYLTCYSPSTAPFLKYRTLSQAEKLWQQAEKAVENSPELLWRVQQGHLPVRYVFLAQWQALRRECLKASAEWALPSLSRKAIADEWLKTATGAGPENWSSMTHLNEGAVTPQAFVANLQKDPPDPVVATLSGRKATPLPPKDLPKTALKGVDAQDSLARLWNEGEGSETRDDPQASDGVAVWLPTTHREWAFQIPLSALPKRAQTGQWRIYVVVRVERNESVEPSALAFTAGVYDNAAREMRGSIGITAGDAATEYKSYLLGTVDVNTNQYVWVAPSVNKGLKAVWVDRVYMVPVASTPTRRP
jgi:hypothetical protein